MKVLITGASRGIGRATAELLSKKGYTVFGTTRFPEKYEGKIRGVKLIYLDMNKPETIDKVPKITGEIDILINNAGKTVIGSMEETPIEKVLEYLWKNLVGHIKLTQYYIPYMRKRGNGFIINIGSLASEVVVPFNTLYSITKFAFKAYSLGLRQELSPFGVKVILIEPGYINTGFPQEILFDENSPYYTIIKKIKQTRDKLSKNGSPPQVVANLIYDILQQKKVKPIYRVGRGSKLVEILKCIPPEVIEKVILKYYNR